MSTGDGCLGLTFVPERFRKPVFPGDEIGVEIVVSKIREPMVEVDVTLGDQQGKLLIDRQIQADRRGRCIPAVVVRAAVASRS